MCSHLGEQQEEPRSRGVAKRRAPPTSVPSTRCQRWGCTPSTPSPAQGQGAGTGARHGSAHRADPGSTSGTAPLCLSWQLLCPTAQEPHTTIRSCHQRPRDPTTAVNRGTNKEKGELQEPCGNGHGTVLSHQPAVTPQLGGWDPSEPLPWPVPALCSHPSPSSPSPFPLLEFHLPNSFLWLKTSTDAKRPLQHQPRVLHPPHLNPTECPLSLHHEANKTNSMIYIPPTQATFYSIVLSSFTQKPRRTKVGCRPLEKHPGCCSHAASPWWPAPLQQGHHPLKPSRVPLW